MLYDDGAGVIGIANQQSPCAPSLTIPAEVSASVIASEHSGHVPTRGEPGSRTGGVEWTVTGPDCPGGYGTSGSTRQAWQSPPAITSRTSSIGTGSPSATSRPSVPQCTHTPCTVGPTIPAGTGTGGVGVLGPVGCATHRSDFTARRPAQCAPSGCV